MASNDDQFEVFVFQTNILGSTILILNGEILGNSNPIRNNPASAYINDLGKQGFRFKSQLMVSTFVLGNLLENRIQWVFERMI